MPDITMCKDFECPRRRECYRFLATPKLDWQSWFAESPRQGQECDRFWRVVEEGRGDE